MTAQDQLDARNKHRLTVDGICCSTAKVRSAIGGRNSSAGVYYMSPKHRPHARTVTELVLALAQALKLAVPAYPT